MSSPIRGPIQVASHTAAYWAAANTVLLLGQQGLETDTNRFKFGDGITPWNSLSYASSGGTGGGGAALYTDLTDAATVNLPVTNAPLLAALAAKAPTANPTFTGTVTGVTKSAVG